MASCLDIEPRLCGVTLASYSLSLSFLICKMEKTDSTNYGVVVKAK